LSFSYAENLDIGEKIFNENCNVCHLNNNNLIIPEKNLTKQSLKLNGLLNLNAMIYEITNGKNGMPGFINRLTESEINQVAKYILEK
jgi:cytochrome c6